MIRKLLTISGTSPAAPGTAIVGSAIGGLQNYDWFTVSASLIGATGGTLDVYLQRQVALDAEVAGGVWEDWLHFAQLAAGAAAIKYAVQSGTGTTVSTVGQGTDASAGTPALTANFFIGAHPGQAVRCVCVAGGSTSAGAAVLIYLNCLSDQNYR